jgi:hypothetical protein
MSFKCVKVLKKTNISLNDLLITNEALEKIKLPLQSRLIFFPSNDKMMILL